VKWATNSSVNKQSNSWITSIPINHSRKFISQLCSGWGAPRPPHLSISSTTREGKRK